MNMSIMCHIDTHTHLDCPDFDADRQEIVERASAAGVKRLLVMGITQANWDGVWRLALEDDRFYAAFGLHPIYLEEHTSEHVNDLRQRIGQLAAHSKCCAIGEIGLDYFLPELDRDRQQQLLEAQLAIALDFNLPVLLHVRRAHAAMIATLKRFRLPRAGIVHAFAGSREEAREYIKLGFKLGLGGAATWEQARRIRRVVAELPAQSLVLETDAPDMAPSFHAYQRNSPEYLPEICAALAALRNETTEQLAHQCLHNTCELFGWDPAAVC